MEKDRQRETERESTKRKEMKSHSCHSTRHQITSSHALTHKLTQSCECKVEKEERERMKRVENRRCDMKFSSKFFTMNTHNSHCIPTYERKCENEKRKKKHFICLANGKFRRCACVCVLRRKFANRNLRSNGFRIDLCFPFLFSFVFLSSSSSYSARLPLSLFRRKRLVISHICRFSVKPNISQFDRWK